MRRARRSSACRGPNLLTLPLTFLLPFVFGEQGIWMVPVFAEVGMFILAFIVLSQNAKRRGWRYGLLPVQCNSG